MYGKINQGQVNRPLYRGRGCPLFRGSVTVNAVFILFLTIEIVYNSWAII